MDSIDVHYDVYIDSTGGSSVVFSGRQYLVQSIINILYWMLLKLNVYITFAFKTIQVKWIFEFVFRTAHTTPVRIYGEPYAHKFCAIDIFWKITCRQAISHVVKFHHVLGRGFMIQRVILILSNVSQPIRINYFTWNYDIDNYW